MLQEPLRAICWDGDAVAILDQRLLPERIRIIRCTTAAQVLQAIQQMDIRGAPAIGIAGAMALALGARGIQATHAQTFRRKFQGFVPWEPEELAVPSKNGSIDVMVRIRTINPTTIRREQ